MKIKIKQIKCSIGAKKNQRDTIKVSVEKIEKTVEKFDPSIEGMINKVKHLVEVSDKLNV